MERSSRLVTFEPRPAREPSLAARIAAEAAAWTQGRSWILRAPLLAWLAYVGVRQFGSTQYASLFAPLNLGIHEAGHFVFAPLGAVFHAAGGTLLQLIAPLATLAMFLRQPDWFAASVTIGWLATNVHHVGTYMADAEDMALPLVTVGSAEGVTHDWRFLFERFDLLHRCEAIGAVMHGLGHLTMLAALASGTWLLWRMATAGRRTV